MILAQALAEVRVQRTPRMLPDGQTIWVSRVFPTSDATPEMPMASFVEQMAHTIIPTHFHAVNQFQVVVEGQGTLGKRAVHPWTVHYTNGFTGYGPLCAAAAGMAFFTLRNRWDAGGAHYFPAGQSFMQPAPKRHHLVGPLVLSSVAALHSRQQVMCDPVLAQEEDGLAAWFLRLGSSMRAYAPDPAPGGGQYLLVAGGTLLHDGAVWPRLSCLYVSADTGPFVLQSGAEGLEILLLQFPVAEAAQTQPGAMSRTRKSAHGAPETDNMGAPRPSGSRAKPALAHPEHVALVQQGATAIAAWREAHPGERLHLAEADLAGVNLRGANLHGARLSGAILDGADLVGANLQHADLRAASLVEADLTGARLQHASLVRAHLARVRLPWARLPRAHLHGAYLHEAYLQEANLQRAYLVGTDLSGADLRGAYMERSDLQWANLQETILRGTRLQGTNLHESVMGSTIFDHTHLHGTKGLDTCRHQAPSPLDVGTCTCSGSLPTDFLRGCGWSDARIANQAGQLWEPPVSACIERSLALPTTYRQAGLSLLTSVSTVLHQQHPDISIHCRLEHSGPMIRLLIDIPVGVRETVEQTLQAYGGVMAERQSPTAWHVDLAQAPHLRQPLEGAATALRLTYDVSLRSEPPDVPLPLTVAERLRHLRQLVGNALQDL
jgi:uncharacterized protein YjbI with pentapeptide repeats